MALRISGKNLDIGEALRDRIAGRVNEAAQRYIDGRVTGHVTVEKEAHGFRTIAALHLPTGMSLQAEAFAPDAYAACDLGVERIEKRLRRYARRLKDRAGHHAQPAGIEMPYVVIEAPKEETEDEGANGAFEPVIIAEQTSSMRRMTVADAVLELDLTGAAALVFHHAVHGRVNVVYRRADGHVGWIDPPAMANGSA
ncbi:ribosome hibernation-promoting factor, HPF/YfiA family [Phreatobacter cathodiphilus]|uniref:Ribosome hibernation promoting factor n=1 Tax=Phreatobacter cathodiphilus TaxID=1868589 RepID=A0A2S0NGB3_9HYPH|nr:ribosome-associated translation inhibitor RaiA [Phreatobacter cathodiphilus]AVO46943.1 ribosome-associated translation inhibitor RaiA [Phreatobacter cathodiphilus]